MPVDVCQVTDWLAAGLEFASARAWTVQVKWLRRRVKAGSERGESGRRSAGELSLEVEAVGERGGDDGQGGVEAVTAMEARPSPVAVTEQVGRPQARVADPLVTA